MLTTNPKVVMIIQSYFPLVGGAERQIAALAPRLQADGVDIHILTRRYAGLKPFEIIDGVPVHRLPVFGPKMIAAISYIFSGIGLLHRLKPDVIHAHELLSPALMAILAKRLFSTPVVAKVLRGGILGDIAKLRGRIFSKTRISLLRNHIDFFISISSEIDAELRDVGVLPDQLLNIPNGVDTEKFAPVSLTEKMSLRTELSLPPGPLVVFVGRLAPEKRLDDLLSVWPNLKNTVPDARLLVIGTGEERARLEKNAPQGVSFLGLVDNVSDYLQAADLFVLPSSTEGLSNAMLEAMAVGLPVVTTSVGGAPDVIVHRENGWLVVPGDTVALEKGVHLLLTDNELRANLGRKARETVEQGYALRIVAKKLLTLYSQLVAENDRE